MLRRSARHMVTSSSPLRYDCGSARSRSSVRDTYKPVVELFRPGATVEERDLHCSVLFLGHQAASRLRRCSDDAYGLYCEIAWLATQHGFSPRPIEELRSLRETLVRITLSATALDRLANEDTGLVEEGC